MVASSSKCLCLLWLWTN